MARAGEKLYNPIQGDWMVFRQTARDTGEKLLSAELIVSPHGVNPSDFAASGILVLAGPYAGPHQRIASRYIGNKPLFVAGPL
jgi:hypothetical protein